MRIEQQMVAEFHKAAGDSDPTVPTIPSPEVRILRAKLMLEECLETIRKGLAVDCLFSFGAEGFSLHDVEAEIFGDPQLPRGNYEPEWRAVGSPSMVEIADGCADLKYVTYGTELACGIDGGPVFDEVHKSNMTKNFPKVRVQEPHKITKGPAFRPPDIAGVLERQKHQLPASVLAYEQKAITAMMRSVMEQREEILKAFVAKYGWEPNEVIQECGRDDEGISTWCVRRKTPQELAREARSSEAKIEITEFLENERNTALRLIREGLRGLDAPGQEQRALEPSTEPQWGVWITDGTQRLGGRWLTRNHHERWTGSEAEAQDLADANKEWHLHAQFEARPLS